jgi:putative oxidoreductase
MGTLRVGPVAEPRRAGVDGWLARLASVPLSLHQMLFRLGVASVFLKAGLVKASSWEPTVALFRDEYRVPVLTPELAAGLATAFELGCSTMLIVGLGTRLATLPLLGMIATIQVFVYPSAWPEHFVWGSILLLLLTRGPGVLSLDHVLTRAWARRRGRAGGDDQASGAVSV